MQTASLIVMLILLAVALGMMLLSLTASRPTNLGVRDGRLAACPDSPNCVSSQAEDHDHWIAPLTYSPTADNVIDVLEKIVLQLPRTQVIEKTHNYLHVEVRSSVFRFTDDVEFYVDVGSDRVHVRSASRVGRSDLGVNRARIEAIRSLLRATTQDGPNAQVFPQATRI